MSRSGYTDDYDEDGTGGLWRGYETCLKQAPSTIGGLRCTQSVCPSCGHDEYMFMTPGEIKAWERAQRAAAQKEAPQ